MEQTLSVGPPTSYDGKFGALQNDAYGTDANCHSCRHARELLVELF